MEQKVLTDAEAFDLLKSVKITPEEIEAFHKTLLGHKIGKGWVDLIYSDLLAAEKDSSQIAAYKEGESDKKIPRIGADVLNPFAGIKKEDVKKVLLVPQPLWEEEYIKIPLSKLNEAGLLVLPASLSATVGTGAVELDAMWFPLIETVKTSFQPEQIYNAVALVDQDILETTLTQLTGLSWDNQ